MITQTETVTPENIEEYLLQHQQKELLRFVSVGSVDDGKSTLIGRLLHDTHGVYEDQLSAVKKATSQRGANENEEIDFSLFTDGLKAEREQGITIDVAYRYFSTAKRKFIIADTPGHVQYTRNMATGASTANVCIILIDARHGVLQQSRRHAYIASLLGIPHLLVAVNKMDLEGYEQKVFAAIQKEFSQFASKLRFKEVRFIPISAKLGDNVVHPSSKMPWHDGGTFLEYLESVPVAADRNYADFRFPVQNVIRPNLDYRGFAGEVASGVLKPGDTVMVLPSRKTSTVKSVDTFAGPLEEANPSTSVVVTLKDEIDISRGDMLVHPKNLPIVSRSFRAHVVWLSERPLDLEKSYLMKHTTQLVRVNVDAVESVKDLETLADTKATSLGLNDIGELRLTSHRPIFFDAYEKNRVTGAFILIDSLTNNTVAAGMLTSAVSGAAGKDEGAAPGDASLVSSAERVEAMGQRGTVVELHAEGATAEQCLAFAHRIERVLYDRGRVACVLGEDGLERAGTELVKVGAITIAVGKTGAALAKSVAAQRGEAAVLRVTVGERTLKFGTRDVAASESEIESAAGQVVDELENRDRFVG
jgi:sulfate adenylyltransferase large subunit